MSRGGIDQLRSAGRGLAICLVVTLTLGADEAVRRGDQDLAPVPSNVESWILLTRESAGSVVGRMEAWYRRTPPADRMTWSGLIACAVLGGSVLIERMVRIRRSRVLPARFSDRWIERLEEGPMDRAKALDLCELNPSPASRIALAALRRWGRPVADLERAVGLARKVEVDRLGRNLGTLRRVATIAPLIGLLGSLLSVGRSLERLGATGLDSGWGSALAHSLIPLTAGVALSIVALLAFDGLTARMEALVSDLDRLGAETVDAIALATPVARTAAVGPGPQASVPSGSHRGPHFRPVGSPTRPSVAMRVELPEDLKEF